MHLVGSSTHCNMTHGAYNVKPLFADLRKRLKTQRLTWPCPQYIGMGGSAYSASPILRLGTRWRWVPEFTPLPRAISSPFPPQGKRSRGPRPGLDVLEERKIFFISRESNPGLSISYTVLTETTSAGQTTCLSHRRELTELRTFF